MDLLYVGLALASACLHAAWNAAVKARPVVATAMTAQMVLAAVFMGPILMLTGLPSAASAKWIALSAVINTIALTAMLRSYAYAGFGVVYPVGRALSVLLVVPGAALVFGERIGLAAVAGVLCISLALAMLAANAGRNSAMKPVAWAWIALFGGMTACNVLVDAQGVRIAGSAIAYGCSTSILNAIVMLWLQRASPVSIGEVKREALAMAPVAVASVTSYLLILYTYTKAPVAPASALRDTSALFAIVIAVLWLKEQPTRTQLLALVLAAFAVPLMRLG